ncbi:MAG: phage tail tape measure C-terminal domain-containing protein [Terasakiella sp.]|uniref:phage tail tape measure C-terminal domain-containing protein n=1 Tax=unclassified Terasakiella TaxID=2614952 RepID=UPI003AFFF245
MHLASEALQFLVENSDAAIAVLGGFTTLKTASALVSIAGGAKAATVALLAMSATPIGAIGLALGTAVAALIYFRNEAVTVGQQTATVTDFVVGAWEYVSQSIAGAWGMAEEFAEGAWAQATFETLQKVVGWYKEMYNTAIAVFASIGDVAVIGADGVADAFDNAFDFIMEGFSDIGGAAKLLFSGDFEEAGQLASNALNRSFQSGLSETGEKIQNSVSENFNKDWLGDWMGAVWQGADELAGGVIDDVAARAAQRYQSRLADLDPGTAPTTQSTGIPDAPANKSAPTRTSKQIKDHENAVKKIRKAYIELLPQQERVAEQAKMWREDAMKGLDPLGKGYKEMKAHLDEIYDDMILQGSTDWDAGFVRGFKKISEEASDTASQVETAMGKAFSGAEDYLVSLSTGTKASFRDMTQSILADIARIIIRTNVISPFANMASSFVSTLFSAKGNAFTPQGVQMFAQGSAFSNSIVSTPTMFQFGGGQLGVMAENDPEAVMPLFRTPSGDLGVKTSGMGGGGNIYVEVIDQRTNADSDPVEVEPIEGPGGMEGARIFIRDTNKKDMARGGYDQTMRNRWGMEPKARRR